MKARWTTILGGTRTGGTTATAAVTATSSAKTTTAGTGTTGGGTRSSGGSSSSSFRIRALATTVRRGAAAAVASRYFFLSDDEAQDDTTSASSPSSQPFLPLPCPLTEQRSPPAGAEDGAAANDDDDDDEDDRDDKPDLGLWYIHGKAYDLAGFMAQHPGGADALALARGRDCTALFESYHPFSDKPRQLLPKFLVPSACVSGAFAASGSGDTFYVPLGPDDQATRVRDPFWEALRRDCGAYLATHHVDIAMSWPFFLFGLAMIALQIGVYAYGFRHGSYPAAFTLGFASWLVAGTFGHEGLHYGISRRFPWLNPALGFYSMFSMCNPIIWKHQHTYSHHSHTNDHLRDPDCHHFETMLRVHFANPHNALHRLLVHRLWVLVWWSQAMFGSVVLLPLKSLATGRIQGATSLHTLSWRGRLGIVLHTVLFFLVFWILPYATMRRAKMAALGLEAAPVVMPDLVLRMCGLFTCFQTTLGAFFGTFTQATHLTEASMEPAARADGRDTWAKRQVETAANFAEASLFWFVLSGGLNLQIEHHLFPGLSHDALRQLTPVIRRTCKVHGVHFKSYPTFGDLLGDVLAYFARLASEEKQKQGKLKEM